MPGVQPKRAIEAPSGSLQRFPLSAGDAELAVAELRRITKEADGLLIATPTYNGSMGAGGVAKGLGVIRDGGAG